MEKTSRAMTQSQEGAWDNEGDPLARVKESIREQSNREVEK